MKVLMIEDQRQVAKKIRELLKGLDETINVVAVTHDAKATAEWLHRNEVPDIILAGKKMMAAAELQYRRDVRTTVTFSTEEEEYRFQALRYNTILKLIPEVKALQPVGKRRKSPAGNTEAAIHHDSYKERFLVKQGQRLLSIPAEQVAYFFSDDRFIFLKTFDNQKFLQDYRMDQLEKMLSPQRFFRVNRSFIISLPTVREIHAYFNHRLRIYLSPAAEKNVIVSRKRVRAFKNWLDK